MGLGLKQQVNTFFYNLYDRYAERVWQDETGEWHIADGYITIWKALEISLKVNSQGGDVCVYYSKDEYS
ncbi:MAG: hypothetical protein R3321_00275 [Nitrososphaeraceae archaeon]|nr:hypothetical protein [Nitrososphaeraceae archaeon]